MVGMNQPMYREDRDMAMAGNPFDDEDGQNGNVSRLLNQVQKELAVMSDELGALKERLAGASISVPTEGMTEGDDAMPIMSPLAETVALVLSKVQAANTRIREMKLGVDL